MNYQQTIDYLYNELPMYSRIGDAAYKKDLHNTIALCEALDNPHLRFKSIHIAGTNGKGSTSHMLASILQQAGYKVGLYTSPHIKDFRERIKINGKMVSEDFVIGFVEHTRHISQKIQPSFFELTVAMAFEYFARQKVDVAIIETGLGGRLDSTNIITPILSIITNIGWDHMNILGNTLQDIAKEKAGIIKKSIPVIIGERNPETDEVFINKASGLTDLLYFAEDEFIITGSRLNIDTQLITTKWISDVGRNTEWEFALDLTGIYQQKNLVTVLSAVFHLAAEGFIVNLPQIQQALKQVKKLTGFAGRWDIINKDPLTVIDVAHNEDGIKHVLAQLYLYKPSKIHFIIGLVKDKDSAKILSLLPAGAMYYFTNAHLPRALAHNELKTIAQQFNLTGESYDDVNDALDNAKQNALSTDIIIVCGSFFIIAEIKNIYNISS
ncbi:MAG: bifunctional folylpolyglutamate synthase/dihydrofolate synthase [Chitinophagaceae bacterium]|nr:bifunctional folylpolyglutamate synthase/dihydrofolate synthase [Chitinophagaceae bacterium]